jgi:hypothetical protein
MKQRNPIDVLAMFISLWLLITMIIDKATPKELTVYMIGTALAPAGVITAVLYWLKVPRYDFAVCVSMLWLASLIVIEIITPKPLSWTIAVIAFAPSACVGIASRLKRRKTTRSRASGFRQPGNS